MAPVMRLRSLLLPTVLVASVGLAALVVWALVTAPNMMDEPPLVGTYLLEYKSLRVVLILRPDHSYSEKVFDSGASSSMEGSWKYTPGNVSLTNVFVPMRPTERTHGDYVLNRTLFVFPIEPCSGKATCLIVSDDDPVWRFVKQ
jgi:hypothetical protein